MAEWHILSYVALEFLSLSLQFSHIEIPKEIFNAERLLLAPYIQQVKAWHCRCLIHSLTRTYFPRSTL